MEAVFEFLRAALPWIAVGLFLAVFFARSAAKKDKKELTGDYGTEGMSLGMCFGAAIGASVGNNTGLGIALGMLLGLAFGSFIKKKERGERDEQD